MALHESMLEEFGLSTVWVRRRAVARGESTVPATHAAESAEVSTVTPELSAAREATAASEAARVTAPVRHASPAPSGDAAQPVHTPEPSPSAVALDDFPWFDDAPATPADPGDFIDDTRSEIAALDWDTLAARVSNCQRCRLCERRTNAVFGVGDREADWMLIGEAPGENEDKQGEPFVGQAGKLLDSMLRAVTLSREQNVFIANVIKCRPPGNRNPEPDEVARCEPYLQRQVALVKPKLIVALGRFAAQSLLKTEASIASLRGRVHDYEGVPVIVTYHPAYLLRSLPDKAKAWADVCLAQATYRESLKALGVTTGGA
jgi:uracil-DNA glycosylase family 4